ncbi:MAG: peroxide stress protein YaaA [Rubrivivax sp.]|nr:peroxide stress protein YaaA [Rubrivivax sp.]
MLLLLSPAKTLNYETPVPPAIRRKATEPLYAEQAAALVAVMRGHTAAQVAALMDLSAPLAAVNVERYAAWQRQPTARNSKPAVLAFDGDVYTGLDAKTLKTADLTWAQQHIVILSGLYGALRPLDRLQPYRLEMGTALKTARGKDLYAFWGDTVVQHLNARQADEERPVIVNLASIEYAQVVLGPAVRPALRAQVVDCVFEERQPDGSHKIVSFFAKKARGLMARFAIERRARSVRALRAFTTEGYVVAPEASSPLRLVFRRG